MGNRHGALKRGPNPRTTHSRFQISLTTLQEALMNIFCVVMEIWRIVRKYRGQWDR